MIGLSSLRVYVLLLPFSVTARVPDPISRQVEENDTSYLFFSGGTCMKYLSLSVRLCLRLSPK